MADKITHTVSLQVDLGTGDFLLQLPSNFDYTGPQAEAVIAMLPASPVRRTDAA